MSHIMTRLNLNDMMNSPSFLRAINDQVNLVKAMYIYADPASADILIRWEINDTAINWLREDF